MSENDTGSTTDSIGDETLPDDLVASDDNPLAEGLPAGEEVGLRDEGKRADEMADPEDEPDTGHPPDEA